ncbi:MAG: Ig-like domain-containing protein [Terracidiphilus sp.]
MARPPPPPTVAAAVPANGATGVPITQALSVTFSEAMNCATLASPATTFTLAGPGTTAVGGTVTCAGSTATFTPAADLAVNTIYTATITTAAQSSANIPLGANFVWTFRTAPAAPVVPPTVISTVPPTERLVCRSIRLSPLLSAWQ